MIEETLPLVYWSCSYLVLCEGILNSLCSGFNWSRTQSQFVQPAQQTFQAFLDTDRLGHSCLQLLSPLRDGRREGVKPLLQTIWKQVRISLSSMST